MQAADQGYDPKNKLMQGDKLRIGIVQARFNADITDALATACCRPAWLN